MSLLVHVEVADPPAFDVVERARLVNAPRGRCDGRRTCLHSSCHAANLTELCGASTLPISSREKATHPPAFAIALKESALVEAELAGVPELDALGANAAAGPVRWPRHGLVRVQLLDLQRAASQLVHAREGLALRRRSRADLTRVRTRGEVCIRLGVGDGLDVAFDANLRPERRPVKAQRGARRGDQLASLAAVHVRVEDEAALVDVLEEDDANGGRAARADRCERH